MKGCATLFWTINMGTDRFKEYHIYNKVWNVLVRCSHLNIFTLLISECLFDYQCFNY